MTSDPTLERTLGRLRATAPPTLAPAVLEAIGLADRYAVIRSPIGPLAVAWSAVGVSAVESCADPAAFELRHRSATGRTARRVDALPPRLERAIGARLAGDRRARVPLDLRGRSPFERDVWQKALEIPHGEVRPYSWIAAEIGRPRAVRAVGTALGHNPVPLIVPCHRVVRSDGTIGQYSLGGPANKRAILAAEGLDPDALEAEARAGVRIVGSGTTRVACLPTCTAARRITAARRVTFGSLAAALAAGFRPCRRCRPASGATRAA